MTPLKRVCHRYSRTTAGPQLGRDGVSPLSDREPCGPASLVLRRVGASYASVVSTRRSVRNVRRIHPHVLVTTQSAHAACALLRYWRHSARRYIRNSLVGGFIPRIRKGGLNQAAIMCAWLVWPNRTLCRYPFLLLPDDRVWRQFGRFWDRWRAYPGRFADASEAGTTAADIGLMPILAGSDSTE